MLARVVERGHARGREVLGDGERLRAGRHPGQRHRAEVLLDVAQQGVAHPLVVQHPSGDQLAAHAAVLAEPEQHPDGDHGTAVVDPHRHRVDVEDRQLLTGEVELFAAQPAGAAAQLEVAHGLDRATSAARSGTGPPGPAPARCRTCWDLEGHRLLEGGPPGGPAQRTEHRAAGRRARGRRW